MYKSVKDRHKIINKQMYVLNEENINKLIFIIVKILKTFVFAMTNVKAFF